MNAVDAFNSTMTQFLTELCETFPECAKLYVTFGLVEEMMIKSETAVLETFVEEIAPYSEQLVAMDENFFLNSNIEFLQSIGIKSYWTPDLEAETKRAIWEYLQTLYVMGSAILTVPAPMLKMIEQYAQKYSEQMADGSVDPSQVNIQELGMNVMQQMGGPQAMPWAQAAGQAQAQQIAAQQQQQQGNNNNAFVNPATGMPMFQMPAPGGVNMGQMPQMSPQQMQQLQRQFQQMAQQQPPMNFQQHHPPQQQPQFNPAMFTAQNVPFRGGN